MTTTHVDPDTPTTEEAISWSRCVLTDIDRALTAAALALAHVRQLRAAAEDLLEVGPKPFAIHKYDLEEPWQDRTTALGLPLASVATLQGAFTEPMRELIAATHAAEAELAAYTVRAEEDHAKVERELRELRG